MRISFVAACGVLLTSCADSGVVQKQEEQPQVAECTFPKCMDDDAKGFVVSASARDEQLARMEPMDLLSLTVLSYELPKYEKTDEYETRAAFQKKVKDGLSSWKVGVLNPKTRLLVGSELPEGSTEYDAEGGNLNVRLPYGAKSAILASRHSTSDNDYGGVRAVQDISIKEGLWFVNQHSVRDPKIDGRCSIKYPQTNEQTTVSLNMTPAEARQSRSRLKMYYVVSFDAPSSASGGEWCWEGRRSDGGAALLIKGGAMSASSQSSYLNVRVHKALLTDGTKVLYSKSYD